MIKIKSSQQKTIFLDKSESFEIEDDANLVCIVVILGGRRKMHFQLSLGERSVYKFFCIFLGSGKDNIRISIVATYHKNNSRGEIFVKGVLSDFAKCQVFGLINMKKRIVNSAGFFNQRTILLSEKASAESLPSLEIASNNVEVKHGVVISQLDKDELFYLMSRGITAKKASKMIVEGLFSAEQKLLSPYLRKKFDKQLEAMI